MMGPLSFPLLVCIALAFSQASSQDTQCDENYQLFKGSCYYLSPKDTWSNGQKKCASNGGNLVSIQTEEENEFVRGLFQNTKSPVWIGGYKYPNAKSDLMKWRWIDGEPMDFLNWEVGQPRDFPKKRTMMMFTSGKWANEVPTQEFPFVCEKMSLPTCDEGYSQYNSYCYRYKLEKLGFDEAQKNCSDDGGNLASVHSLMEDLFLKALTEDTYAWIGGKRDKGLWTWTDGTPFNYKHWAKYQPAQNPDNNCILINYPDGEGGTCRTGWTNELCDIAYGYVCKKPQRRP